MLGLICAYICAGCIRKSMGGRFESHHPQKKKIDSISQSYGLRSAVYGFSHGLKTVHRTVFAVLCTAGLSNPITHKYPYKKESSKCYSLFYGVGDGIRTHEYRNHTPVP